MNYWYQYLVATKIEGRLSVRKCIVRVQQFDKEIFNLKKLNDVEVKKQQQVKI
jgi:hypothetical protein